MENNNLETSAKRLKFIYNSVREMFQNFPFDKFGVELPENLAATEIFERDFITYMLYIGTADGNLSWDACYVIGHCIGKMNLSPAWVNGTLLADFNRQKFAGKIPPSIYLAEVCDRLMLSAKIDNQDNKISDILIGLYSEAGEILAKIDGNISGNEFRNHNAYIDMMKSYVQSRASNPSAATGSAIAKDPDTRMVTRQEQEKAPSMPAKGPENDKSLEDLVGELNRLIGLSGVKTEVNSLINMIKNKKRREKMGLKSKPMSMHLVFTGNPGTGKTTVARLLGKIYFKLGILSKGHFIETQRSGLVGGYVGQTAIKVQDVIKQALGGILFIDEAYALAGKGDNDYGREAIDTLLKEMEDHRDDLVVIAAGYPEEMDKFLESNPGLPSRFNKQILFEDYNPDELTEIFLYNCAQEEYCMDDVTQSYIRTLFAEQYSHRDKFFGNGRFVRNFYEKVMSCQINRLAELGDHATKSDLQRITLADVKGVDIATVH